MPGFAAASATQPLSAAELQAVLDDPIETDPCTRWTTSAAGQRLAESWLQLSGMYCAACAGAIEAALRRVDGVRYASVVAATQRATVVWDPAHTRLSGLVEAVRLAGYEAVPDAAAPARELRRREHRAALWRLFVASFCAMQVMMLATPSYVAAPGELTGDLQQLLNWGQWVLSLPVLGFSAGPIVISAVRQLRQWRVGMDTPVAVALTVTFVASMGATFDPQGQFGNEVYFDSLTMFLSFLLGGRYLELRARHRAADDLEQALARMPESCERRRPDGSWEVVSVRRLQRGNEVRVAAGQAFPADGVLLQGHTLADESLLTGESVPWPRQEGDAVVAASINVGAPVVMRVDRAGADTRYVAIITMMREALSQRPAFATLADRWASPFLWAVLGLAALAALVWWWIEPTRALWVAVSVLVVTCPCAFSLAAPASLVAAAGGLARRGVVFKRLEAIEALAGVQRVVFDKTGTLTEDRVDLAAIKVRPGVATPEADLRLLAASLAAWSRHPLAQALARVGQPGPGQPEWSHVDEVPGHGVQGQAPDGSIWRVGSWTWVSEPGIEAPYPARVWISRNGLPLASCDFDETLRPGAAQALQALRAMGLSTSLLSGDDLQRAGSVARRLGIDDVHAQATPEGKLAWMVEAQRRGDRVLMVGDGVNDAPVLSRADVSLAMGQGALVARSHADAVLVSGRPQDVVLAVQVARRTMGIVRQNMAWAAAYNAACIPLALVGWLPPWMAGLGMACSSLAVIGNAMRAGR